MMSCRRLGLRGLYRASPPQALDDDNLLEEILLRIPPHPSSLNNAGLVCNLWRRLVTDAQFVRRFHAHHQSPPLLGFFLVSGMFLPVNEPPYKYPSTLSSVTPWAHGMDMHMWRMLSCRHGFVLTQASKCLPTEGFRTEFMVMDPMTGNLSRTVAMEQAILVAATVVAVAGGDSTGRRSFRLIALFFNYGPTRLTASVYSSDSGDWVDSVATLFVPSTISFIQSPSTLVGNALYWLLNDAKTILQFDLESQSLASVEQPRRGRGHADVDRRRHRGGAREK
ncbi:hypothetical protein PR202_ga27862 [Eleusine coracana subsp. coracana]|uniref:F-box domain-containing protein n=1 Tax=Eleusine coracana subsp. coracana TaxID=191504 RepID=A0AAV5DHY0_ELECO|nr:hypothetical protein PR202_ga27862 [Eleusine coracana subsp. coracana]